jgi:predicted Zn-dependent protease
VNFYSLEEEAALGRQLAAEFRKSVTVVESPAVLDYVQRIGRRLAAHLPAGTPPFTFTLIAKYETPTHEPHALPGGHVFVSTALILAARDEAEFAGMLAHAMMHVVGRHGTRSASREELIRRASLPQPGSGIAVPLGSLQFQRGFERQADEWAARTMAAAGFDPLALARYIERVHTDAPSVFSPLPAREQRIASLKETIRVLPAGTYTSGEGFAAIQDNVRRLVPRAP